MMALGAVIAPSEPTAVGAVVARGEYRCDCGHRLRVFGGGRHRVFFERASASLEDPVMNRACPQCGRRLPGKGRPYETSAPSHAAGARLALPR